MLWVEPLSLGGACLVSNYKVVFVRMFTMFCAMVLLFTTACTPQQKQEISHKQAREHRLLHEQGNSIIPMRLIDGQYYVSADQWIDGMQYNAKRNGKGISFGHTDRLFQFTANSSKGFIGEQLVQLSEAPIWRDDDVWFSASLIEEAFQDEARFDIQENQITLLRNAEMLDPYQEDVPETPETDKSLDFTEENTATDIDRHSPQDPLTMQSQSKSVDVDRVIAKARKYLGIKYEFGASPYDQSNRFDCSSFIQHIFEPYGIQFPRVSRNQAKKGFTVSRSSLKKGDLLYFYVPNRFSTDERIGHVGLYIGNGNMIHASPAPKDGVQITNIHKKYWKDTFITAKRVIS